MAVVNYRFQKKKKCHHQSDSPIRCSWLSLARETKVLLPHLKNRAASGDISKAEKVKSLLSKGGGEGCCDSHKWALSLRWSQGQSGCLDLSFIFAQAVDTGWWKTDGVMEEARDAGMLVITLTLCRACTDVSDSQRWSSASTRPKKKKHERKTNYFIWHGPEIATPRCGLLLGVQGWHAESWGCHIPLST